MPRSLDLPEKVVLLREFYRREQRVPSYAEMMEVLGYRSKSAVHRVVERLEAAGYLRRTRQGKVVFGSEVRGSLRLLGAVQAGFPSPAEEELADVLSLDEFLVRQPDATYMLTVSGDSMIDAGIHPGDIVLVEKGRNPRNGAIVIAQVDGEWTLKYYRKDRKGIRLEPANAKYATIVPKRDLVIGGVVRAVVRKYED